MLTGTGTGTGTTGTGIDVAAGEECAGCGDPVDGSNGVACERCWTRVPLDLRLMMGKASSDEEWYADESVRELRTEIQHWLRRHPDDDRGWLS